jgi:hypothetical protein
MPMTLPETFSRIWRLWKSPMVRTALFYIVAWFVLIRPVVTSLFLLPGVWGPSVEGILNDGSRIEFRSRRLGGASDDQLIWKFPGFKSRLYQVNRSHAANIDYVKLRYCKTARVVYVETHSKIVAVLFLETDEFMKEGFPLSEEVMEIITTCDAVTIAEGYTESWLQWLWPL